MRGQDGGFGLAGPAGLAGRRRFLAGGAGFGLLALSGMLEAEERAGRPADPFAPKPPPLPARAKAVIFLFADGGPSHLDLLDPKPRLNELAGQPLPASFGRVDTANGVGGNRILGSPRRWKRCGKGGLPISNWLPHLHEVADRLCVVRSLVAEGKNHAAAVCQMNTGALLPGRPCLGSWATYGLGTANRNLPAFAVLTDEPNPPPGGPANWAAGFLPPELQGTRLQPAGAPIPALRPPPEFAGEARQRGKADFIRQLNRRHLEERDGDPELAARLAAFEAAFRLQAEAPEAVALADEPAAVREAYGLHAKRTAKAARACLLARRLVERGVRFVQVYLGSGCQWDGHEDIEDNHAKRCAETDQPVAALVADLARSGLLDSTLVVWGGEFGRTPMSELGKGRDHNPAGFSMWLAGAGITGGRHVGGTDELGLRAVDKPIPVADFHASILRLLGLDHKRLTRLHLGREERLTGEHGKVVPELLA